MGLMLSPSDVPDCHLSNLCLSNQMREKQAVGGKDLRKLKKTTWSDHTSIA